MTQVKNTMATFTKIITNDALVSIQRKRQLTDVSRDCITKSSKYITNTQQVIPGCTLAASPGRE